MSRLLRLVALVSALAVLVPGAAAARSPSTELPADRAPARFATLDEAIDAGALDAGVAGAARRGSADALVALAPDAATAAAAWQGHRVSPDEMRQGWQERKDAALAYAGGTVTVRRDYEMLGVIAVTVAGERPLLALLNAPGVRSVQPNVARHALLNQSLVVANQPAAVAAGHDGAGTSVAVLDTGIDYTRAAFGSCTSPGQPASCRVPFAADFAPQDNVRDAPLPGCSAAPYCHGTHVAGIVAGAAPATKVLSLDIFEGQVAWDEAILGAINWVVANQARYGIRALNLSVGDSSHHMTSCIDSPYASAFASARAVGVVPVVAAGNDGSAGPGVASPACAPGSVSVGAVYDADVGTATYGGCSDASTAPRQVTCFSQRGPTLSLYAPGAVIDAAGLRMSGTSQATPHVAAAAAILADARPSASAADRAKALVAAGDPPVGSSSPPRVLDIAEAVQVLLAMPATLQWEGPIEIESDMGWSHGRELARGGSILHTAYTYPPISNPKTVIRYRRSTNGAASWSVGVQLSSSSHHADWAATAGYGANVYVAWTRFLDPGSGTAGRHLYVRRHTNYGSGSWQPIVALTSSGRIDAPAVAAYGTYVYVVYTNSATGGVYMRRSVDSGASWGSPISLGVTSNGSSWGRWGGPVVAAYGSYVAVAYRSNTSGAIVARISSNRGASWTPATTLSSSSSGGLDVGVVSSRVGFAWTTSSGVKYRSWKAGAWQTLRSVYAVGATRVHKSSSAVSVALVGTNGVGLAFTGCQSDWGCDGDAGQVLDLIWRESSTDGSSWNSPKVLATGNVGDIRHLNDAPDAEWGSSTKRYIAFNGWNAYGDSRMYALVGAGPQP